MEFSTKAENLQLNHYGTSLYICLDQNANHLKAQHEIADLLYKNLNEEENFAVTQIVENGIVENGTLKTLAVVRLPKNPSLSEIEKVAKQVASQLKHEQINLCLAPFNEPEAAIIAKTFALAFGEVAYQFDRYKKEAQPTKLKALTFYHATAADSINEALKVAASQLYGMQICKDLGNAAPNECIPEFLASSAKAEAEKVGAHAKIIEKDYIKANMGAFWSVAKGSIQDPYLVELSYFGADDKNAAPVVLVGKGITFDSGGISLKPGLNMDEMKYDMCGAATVIGTFCAAAKLGLPINLIAIIPTCENLPSGSANKPGDVVTSMKGLSIEVLNTDAEGRLILCDALTYAEKFQPRAVIDVATLTGACIIALGHDVSGLMGNNQNLIDGLLRASEEANDKAWQLPLFDCYKEQLKSNFADLSNIGTPGAGSITAGVFLSHFTEAYPWAHLDIAGTAWKSGKEKGATGRPVPLLLNYLRKL